MLSHYVLVATFLVQGTLSSQKLYRGRSYRMER